MNRKEFLETLGLGAAFVLTSTCLGSCKKENLQLYPTEPVDFTIDLTDAAYQNLAQNGGYIIKNGVVVARNNNGEYVAATQICSHEGTRAIILKNNEWFCTDHDARFTLDGTGLNDEGKRGLTIYQTTLNGDMLHVFS